MNTQRIKKKKSIADISLNALLIILAASVVFAVLYTIIANTMEKHIYPRKYSNFVEKYSAEFGVPENIIYAVIKTESDFERTAASSSEPPALGLMQLTEETYEWVSGKLKESPSAFEIYDPETNIKYGVWYLSYLYARFDNWDTAFAAYNAGPGNVSKWLKDEEYSSDGETLFYIPFKETRNYLKKVNKQTEIYRNLYYTSIEEIKEYEQ